MDDISVAICDDSALMRNLVSRAIEDVPGLKVVAKAMNGRFLTEKIPEAKPDVIVLDIEMPEMNGLEASKAIRAMTRSDAAKVPIIALTANAFDEDVQQSLDAGMVAHLTKPIEPDALYSTLERLIEG